MDGWLGLCLLFSLGLNVLTLRWALHEHAGRRQYQQEAAVLAHTLRSLGSGPEEPALGRSLLPWLLGGLLLAGLLGFVLIFLNVTGL